MKTELLHQKLERYVTGKSMPAETRQIQTWLSCTTPDTQLTPEEKSILELEILHELQAYTAYPLFYPKEPWWKKLGDNW